MTTVSPGLRPEAMTARLSWIRSTFTVRDSTVMSLLTTITNWPVWPLCTACVGTTTRFFSVVSVKMTFRYWPGQSALSVLGKVAFSRMVPVVVSTRVVDERQHPRDGRSVLHDDRLRLECALGLKALDEVQVLLGH